LRAQTIPFPEAMFSALSLWLAAAAATPVPDIGARYHLAVSGVFVSVGRQEALRFTRYQPAACGAEWGISPRRYSSYRPPKRPMLFYAEPVIAAVRTPDALRHNWEGGATAGFRWMFASTRGATFHASITSGPYYYSAQVERQAPGFLFSDNFSLGAYFQLGNALQLNSQVRWRHLSNAGLMLPNNGINTVHVVLGISRMKRAPCRGRPAH